MVLDPEVAAELKRRARAVWSSGNYDAVVDGIWSVGGLVTGHAGVGPGDRVLDVACGSGNAAIQAAMAGGKVTGLDVTPELFPAGRERAARAGVEVEFVEGDAQDLPFEDGSFDVVLSTFGSMFPPRHERVADEIVRVLRPGGRVALANWDGNGSIGTMFRTAVKYLPPPPPGAGSPLAWGDPDHVRDLFDDRMELTFTPMTIDLSDGAPLDDQVDRFISVFPPLVTARRIQEQNGSWDAALEEIRPAVEGMFLTEPSYLLVGGVKR